MIRCLDSGTVSKLRGSVLVESPEAAVRELVQNSIDAGARHITLKFHFDTLSLCVEDDGEGIAEEDLPKVGLANHTSKYDSPQSYGYRGEAVYALYNTSSCVVVYSKQRGGSRWQSEVLGDEDEKVLHVLNDFFGPSFGPHGTVVMISRLFGPFPVRWELAKRNVSKLMRSIWRVLFMSLATSKTTVEAYLIESMDEKSSVRKVLDTRGCSTIPDLFVTLFGPSKLDFYHFQDTDTAIDMFITQEPILRRDLKFVFFESRALYPPKEWCMGIGRYIFQLKYGSMKGYFNQSIDNQTGYVILVTSTSTSRRLLSDFMSERSTSHKEILDSVRKAVSSVFMDDNANKITPRRGRVNVAEQASPSTSCTISSESEDDTQNIGEVSQDLFKSDPDVINQVDSSFILIKSEQHIYIADQHACDERVIYEELLKEFLDSFHDPFIDMRVKCPVAIEIDLEAARMNDLVARKDYLRSFGIDFALQNSKIAITHLPAVLISKAIDISSLRSFMFELADVLYEDNLFRCHSTDWFRAIERIPKPIREVLATKSCKLAIKFGKRLSTNEMAHLIGELGKCRLFTQCSHGRPTIVPLGNIDTLANYKAFQEDFTLQ
ncbi:hypothetical protein FDK38_001019 [Candidozyma auris]|nr:hypothetical protein FDK38_001019 [[Candida] auris]